jgi:hypothetical protein
MQHKSQSFSLSLPGHHKEANCLHCCVRHYKLAADVFCDNCAKDMQKRSRSERNHQQQKLDDADGKRTAANNRTSFASLSPGEKDSRMANLASDRKFHRLTSTRLREGLNSSKAKFKHMDCASGFRELIAGAFVTLAKLDTEEKAAAKQHVIKELVGFSVGGDAAKIKEEEAVEFAAYLMTEIDNKGKQLAGKPNQVDFTPALLQSAIASCLRTKVGYKDQRALSPLAMPSPSTMNRLLRDTRLKEGCHWLCCAREAALQISCNSFLEC